MKPEAQRIAIAEACGFESIRLSSRWECTDPPADAVDLCGIIKGTKRPTLIPDYLVSLDAMHLAEKVLFPIHGAKWKDYHSWVSKLSPDWSLVHATAPVKAEAFLRTLNLWKP